MTPWPPSSCVFWGVVPVTITGLCVDQLWYSRQPLFPPWMPRPNWLLPERRPHTFPEPPTDSPTPVLKQSMEGLRGGGTYNPEGCWVFQLQHPYSSKIWNLNYSMPGIREPTWCHYAWLHVLNCCPDTGMVKLLHRMACRLCVARVCVKS